MTTQCYAMVRGSGIRVTELGSRGQLGDAAIRYAASKSVANVRISEIVEPGTNEVIRNNDEERRLYFPKKDVTIKFGADIKFLRCDPGILSLVSGVPTVTNASGDIVGFDARTKLKATSFALEVWSKLAAVNCVGGMKYGYTVFPFLKGGYLEGFTFSQGLVSFSLIGAETVRSPRWGYGPHDLGGVGQRLLTPVSRNTAWRQFITTAAPPVQTDGIVSFTDLVDGGSASFTAADIVDGEFVTTSAGVLEGGSAA